MIQGQTLSFHPIRLSLSLLPRLVDAPSRTAWALPASFHPSVLPTRPFQLLVPLTSQPYRRESPSPCRGPGSYRYALLSMSIHHSPPPLCHSFIAFLVLVPNLLSSRVAISCGPGYNIPNIFPHPYLSPTPMLLVLLPWSVLSALAPSLSDHVAPPFSRIRLSHSLSSRLPFWPSPALLP